MSDVVTVHRASSSIEAEALRGWLTEEGIECRVDDPRDTAYPGILDRGQRWNLLVAASDEDAARDAISAWNEAEIAGGNGPYRGDAEPEGSLSDRTPSQVARRKMAKRFAFGAVVVTSLCANFYLSLTNYALERDLVEEQRAHDALGWVNERVVREAEQNAEMTLTRHMFELSATQNRLERCEIDLGRATGPFAEGSGEVHPPE